MNTATQCLSPQNHEKSAGISHLVPRAPVTLTSISVPLHSVRYRQSFLPAQIPCRLSVWNRRMWSARFWRVICGKQPFPRYRVLDYRNSALLRRLRTTPKSSWLVSSNGGGHGQQETGTRTARVHDSAAIIRAKTPSSLSAGSTEYLQTSTRPSCSSRKL